MRWQWQILLGVWSLGVGHAGAVPPEDHELQPHFEIEYGAVQMLPPDHEAPRLLPARISRNGRSDRFNLLYDVDGSTYSDNRRLQGGDELFAALDREVIGVRKGDAVWNAYPLRLVVDFTQGAPALYLSVRYISGSAGEELVGPGTLVPVNRVAPPLQRRDGSSQRIRVRVKHRFAGETMLTEGEVFSEGILWEADGPKRGTMGYRAVYRLGNRWESFLVDSIEFLALEHLLRTVRQVRAKGNHGALQGRPQGILVDVTEGKPEVLLDIEPVGERGVGRHVLCPLEVLNRS